MKNDFGGNMPLLDERGRLFGKVNLIDAAVGAFALLLVPLAYAAYLLFKAPPPVVASVEPRIVTVPKGARLEVKGQNLRPFFRAYLGPTAVEYAIMLALIIVVCATAVSTVGTATNTSFSNAKLATALTGS